MPKNKPNTLGILTRRKFAAFVQCSCGQEHVLLLTATSVPLDTVNTGRISSQGKVESENTMPGSHAKPGKPDQKDSKGGGKHEKGKGK